VQLTLNASLEVASEFITTVKFNFDPALNGSLLSLNNSTAINALLPGAIIDEDDITGQGLTFDFAFNFATSAGPERFAGAGTDVFSTLILYNSGMQVLSVSDFQFLSGAQGQNTARYSLAHVQGIPNANPDLNSGWVFGTPGTPSNGAPEPGTLALVGLALISLVAASRRRAPA
jgi:hypothetical protein